MYGQTKGLIIRRTQSAADQSLKSEIDKVIKMLGIPASTIKYRVNDKLFLFPNGSSIKLGYCKQAEDYAQYMGVEYADIAFEELTQHEEEKWNLVGGSNRSNNPNCKAKRWGNCNPGGIGHAWVKERFVDPDTRVKGSLFIQSLIQNNLATLENDPSYCKRVLDVLPDWQRRQWRDGNWDAMAGAYFSLPSHLIRPTYEPLRQDNPADAIEIPYWATWYGGVDFGSAAPFVTLFIAKWQDASGMNHSHVAREIYKANLHLDQQAEQVLEIQELLRDQTICNTDQITYYGDPAIAKRTESIAAEAGKTIRSTWANYKFYVLPAHTNGRVPGWQLLRYLLYKGIITIDPSCKALINEIKSAIYEGTKAGGSPTGEDIQQGTDVPDHALDALRYFIVSTFRVGFSQREIDPYNTQQVATPAENVD